MSNSSTRWLSPLRYPGGKSVLGEFVGHLIDSNRPRSRTYLEPFAGGSGVALHLLFHEHVERIILNDLDPGIAAFWRSVFNHTEELAELVLAAEVTVDEWHRHHQIYKAASEESPLGNDMELGFSTLFLNRTNRSGILTARPIGGLQQTGRWSIDARFNRADLAARIRRLGKYRNRVEIHQEDAVQLLSNEDTGKPFIYADPPYLSKSGDLYLNNLSWEDHLAISDQLTSYDGAWIATYDHDKRVRTDLYPDQRCAEFSLSHSASTQHFGQEYLIFADSVIAEELHNVGPHGACWAD